MTVVGYLFGLFLVGVYMLTVGVLVAIMWVGVQLIRLLTWGINEGTQWRRARRERRAGSRMGE